MLCILGVGSAVGLQSSNITNIMDHVSGKKIKYWHVTLSFSCFGFLSGLVYVTPGGQWLLTLVDDYGGTLLIFFLAIVELAAVFWIYGLENFCWDVEFMLKRKVSPYWRISWGIVTPLFMITIFIYSMVNYQSPTYGPHKFPSEYIAAGWTIFGFGILQIIIWGIRRFVKNFKRYKYSTLSELEIIKKSFQPNDEWGPKDPYNRTNWIKYKNLSKSKRDLMMQNHNHNWFTHKFFVLFGKYDSLYSTKL